MASIANDPGGRRRVLFDVGEVRKVIRLGKVASATAKTFKRHVESLVTASKFNDPIPDDTRRWLDGLADDVHAKFSNVGLVSIRESLQLGPWLTKYVDGRKVEKMKPSSLRKLEQAKAKLLAFFGEHTPLRRITADQASDWRLWMLKTVSKRTGRKLSEAYVKSHCGNVKTIFTDAVVRKLIAENPFKHLPSGSTPRTDAVIISHEDFHKVLDACPDSDWKLWLGFAFYTTLRIPSEVENLPWAAMDWAKGVLDVHDYKREGYAGLERRFVPVVPQFYKLLQDQFDHAPEGTQKILQRRMTGGIYDSLGAIILSAGVERWPDLFTTLRASGESWHTANGVDAHHASMMAGHSLETSRRHYVRSMPDAVMNKIAARPGEVAQNAAQQGAEIKGIQAQTEVSEENGTGISGQPMATCGASVQDGEMGDEGFEPPTSSV